MFFGQEALAEANRYEAALYTAVEYDNPECVGVMLGYLGGREPSRQVFYTKDTNQESLSAKELADVRGRYQDNMFKNISSNACVGVFLNFQGFALVCILESHVI